MANWGPSFLWGLRRPPKSPKGRAGPDQNNKQNKGSMSIIFRIDLSYQQLYVDASITLNKENHLPKQLHTKCKLLNHIISYIYIYIYIYI
jgi:hypothetical protein